MPHLPHPVPHAALLALAVTAGLFFAFHTAWLGDLSQPLWVLTLFVWLFLVIIWGATAVVHQAERLAEFLGEPFGTLILTLSVASIEVMIIAMVMITGNDNPALARDTMFSVTMIVLNGLVGLTLLVGGWRYHEQEYNLRGVNAYLSLTLVLAVFILILPTFVVSTVGPTYNTPQEAFLILMCLGLYGVFLAVQTTRHRGYFLHPGTGAAADAGRTAGDGSALRAAGLLVAHLALVIYLTENLAVDPQPRARHPGGTAGLGGAGRGHPDPVPGGSGVRCARPWPTTSSAQSISFWARSWPLWP